MNNFTRSNGFACTVALLTCGSAGPLVGTELTASGALFVQDAPQEAPQETVDLRRCMDVLLGSDRSAIQAVIDQLRSDWQPNFTTALVEFLRVSFAVRKPGFRTTAFLVIDLLEEKHGVEYGGDLSAWFQLIWRQDAKPHPQSAAIKATLFRQLDPKFEAYFSSKTTPSVRLDEVRWGGVVQDGIPPLREPHMLSSEQAKYLDDDNIVFGIEVNGDVRAYPKRILAWHEMFTDKVGGLEVTGVY